MLLSILVLDNLLAPWMCELGDVLELAVPVKGLPAVLSPQREGLGG